MGIKHNNSINKLKLEFSKGQKEIEMMCDFEQFYMNYICMLLSYCHCVDNVIVNLKKS